MVNPLDAERVEQLSEQCEQRKPTMTAFGISVADVAGLCATARYWRRKYQQLERAVNAELAPVAA